MTSPNNIHPAETGPWIPEPQLMEPPIIPPLQQPKPYCVILLRGMQTRFYNSYDAMSDGTLAMDIRQQLYRRFRFSQIVQHYEEMIP